MPYEDQSRVNDSLQMCNCNVFRQSYKKKIKKKYNSISI